MGKKTGAEMPFLDHLEELRWRLLWIIGALLLGMIIAFVITTKVNVIGLLEKPILPYLPGRKLFYTHPAEPFGIVMKVAFAGGVVIALPVVIYQLWAFLSPALYAHEKRVVIPVIGAGVLLFAGGVALSFVYVLPLTLGFLLQFQVEALEPIITAGQYFGFAITISLAFGAVFELPLVILGLSALGIVSARTLARYRRHAFVLSMVTGAFITPGGDLMSLLVLTLPIYILFEVSVLLARAIERRRERRIAAAERDRRDPREATA